MKNPCDKHRSTGDLTCPQCIERHQAAIAADEITNEFLRRVREKAPSVKTGDDVHSKVIIADIRDVLNATVIHFMGRHGKPTVRFTLKRFYQMAGGRVTKTGNVRWDF